VNFLARSSPQKTKSSNRQKTGAEKATAPAASSRSEKRELGKTSGSTPAAKSSSSNASDAARSSFDENDFEAVYALWAQNGDPALRDQLILMNRSLVLFLARRFADRGESMDDIVQQGMIGLINALDNFDPARGVRFATFATPTIIGEIRRYFRDRARSVRVPRRVQEMHHTVLQKIEALTQEFNRSPTYREIAHALAVPVEDVIETLEAGRVFDPVSLDEPSPGEESLPLSERIGDFDSDLQSADEQALLRAALARLTPRQRRILQYAYFENRSQIEIAGILNVSQMHVSRLLRVALGQLKKHLESDR
jgi:RNA polymerase sigma-B factor